jgi:hypothetical protein
MFFVDELDGVDRRCGTVEDELRLFDDLPYSDGAVAASGTNGTFAIAGIKACYTVLMAEP